LFNFTANFFISEEKVGVIKLNSHYFISASFRNVNNCYKIVDIFQTYLICFSTKKWEITLLNYFHEYAILLHPNFSLVAVDRACPLSVKRSGGVWEEEAPFSENWDNHLPDLPTIAAQLLENGGKIEPYTITIMAKLNKQIDGTGLIISNYQKGRENSKGGCSISIVVLLVCNDDDKKKKWPKLHYGFVLQNWEQIEVERFH
jgi:hypothetical protein